MSYYRLCVESSVITKRLENRTIYTDLITQQQLFLDGKMGYIRYQGGVSTSDIVTNGFRLGGLATTLAQRNAILASVNGILPATPVLLTATPGNRQVFLLWLPSAPNRGLPISGYTITVVNDIDGGSREVPIGNLNGYVIEGLINEESYTFSLYATNPAGNSQSSNTITVTLSNNILTAPTGLRATAGDGQVMLEWNASTTPDVTAYTLVYRESSSSSLTTVPLGNVLTWTVTGLTNGTLYTFYVYAINGNGNSSQNSTTVTIRPAIDSQGLQTIYGGGVQQFGFDNGNYIDGYAFAAMFDDPEGITVDSFGNLYIGDTNNHRIRKIDLSGNVSTFAGNGSPGNADGQGTNAAFFYPRGLTFDSSGNLYATDINNHRIRKIDSFGNVSTFAGNGSYGNADGEGTNAAFSVPYGLTFGSGSLYVADLGNNRIRKIDMSGNVSTFAGDGSIGSADGQGTNAAFDRPCGLTFGSGSLYVVDLGNNRIRKIDPSGNVTTFAGSSEGYADGQGTNASFRAPEGLTFDSSGNLYIGDTGNYRIRKIDSSGNVSTFAGNGSSTYIDAKGTNATFYEPSGIVFYAGNLYIVEESGNIVRKVNIATQDVTTVAGGACTVPRESGDGVGVGTNVLFYEPTGIVKTPNGLFIADSQHANSATNSIKKIDNSGNVTRFVISGLNIDNTNTYAMTSDTSGNLYISDLGWVTNISTIKKIDTSGNVTILAGSTNGNRDGQGTNAQFNNPQGIRFDSSGNLYVADTRNNIIRKIDLSGNVITIAGDGSYGSADGQGTNAAFDRPCDLTFDVSGILYFSCINGNIRKIDLSGNVSTFAGGGSHDYADGQGTNAYFNQPCGIAFYSGNLYVADTYNNRICKIDMSGNVTTFLGGGGENFPGCVDGVGTRAMLNMPYALTVDAGVLYICDTYNNTIRSINLNSNPDPRPTPPTGLSATAGNGQVTLTWNASTGVDVSGYSVVYTTPSSALTTVAVGNMLTSTVTGLTNGTSYTFYVYATNAAGWDSLYSDSVTVISGIPSAPVLVSALATDSQVALTWLASTGDVSGYTVVYSPGSSLPVGNVLTSTVIGLTNGTLYTFSVYATNRFGNGPSSTSLMVTPIALQFTLQTIYGGGTEKIPILIGDVFNTPEGLTVDMLGNVYVADTFNNRIRKIDLSGNISTFAGNSQGSTDGQGMNASFYKPRSITINMGNLYVADTYNNRIRKIDQSGNVSTFAGTISGYENAEGTNARFDGPSGIISDSSGYLYITDFNNQRIRKIDPSGNVSTLAGDSPIGSADGQGTNARFWSPRGMTFDKSGNLYVADTNNQRIRKIDQSGNVRTFAGNATYDDIDGQGTNATFWGPSDVTSDSSGNLYVADTDNNLIRKIDISGNVSTFAGSSYGNEDGQGTNAAFRYPRSIKCDISDNLYVADTNNNQIRKIDLSGNVTTLAGGACSVPNQSGDEVGVGTNVLFDRPSGILKTPNGLFIADSNNDSIKKIDSSGVVTYFVNSDLSLDDTYVVGMAFDSSDAIYFADYDNSVIKKVDTSGNVTIVAGDLGNAGYEDGEGTNALFDKPCGITFDISGNLYVTMEDEIHVIRKIDPSGNVTTFAGDGNEAYEDGQGTNASFDDPGGITFDTSGNLYVADTDNSLIRKIDISGNVSTFAGNDSRGYADAQGTNAAFDEPRDIAFYSGSLYVADTRNNLIRKIDMSGNVTTFLGGGPAGNNAGSVDGVGTNAMLNGPTALTVDAGVLYICDTYNNTIRSVNLNPGPRPTPPTGLSATAGNGQVTLTWNASTGVDVSGYSVVYTTPSSALTTVAVGNVLTSTVTGLTNGASYTFYVYAKNAAGWDSLNSTSVTVIPGTPSAPVLVSALPGNGQVVLTWNASIGNVSGYTVVYSTGSSLPVGNVLTSTVTGLTNGTLYTFSVYATNGFGNGPSSASLTATPVASQTILQTIYGGGTQKIPVGGYYDGNGILVQFNYPQDLTFDSSGNLYVADTQNNRIRKIDLSGNVSTVAGNGSYASADAQGTNAAFAFPQGLIFDSSGNLYIADTDNHLIRKIDMSGNVSTFAGSSQGSADGEGTNAAFRYPQGLTFDSGNLYISDTVNNRIRKIDLSGNVSTVAGNGSYDGNGILVQFNYPQDLTFDSSGSLYIADTGNNRIRKIDLFGNVSTFAGSSEGSADGQGINASFNDPRGITFDSGNLYVADTWNHRIRKIDLSGNVSTFAGSSFGFADGQGTNAAFAYPQGLTFDSFNNSLYVADTSNDIIRKIDLSGNVTTLAGGACSVPNQSGDGIGVGTNVLFNYPSGILKTPNGLFIADGNNNSIKKIDSSGVVTRFVDSDLSLTSTYVVGMAFDSSDAIYIADTFNNVIKKVDTSGNVTIVAGDLGNSGYDDGEGTNAAFDTPCGITFDFSGNLYVADKENRVIRKIDSSGNVSTFAGDGSSDSADGEGTNASFDKPCGITVDSSGNLYVADYSASLIRKINIDTQMVTTFAGNGTDDYIDAQGTNAAFNDPRGIAFYSGNLYVADIYNHLIRKIDMSGNVTTFLGGGSAGKNAGSIDGVGTNAMLQNPTALTVDGGVLYICDTYNNTIRSVNL